MFSSKGIISRDSYAYKAWLAGTSRTKLQKSDLDVDIELIIDAVAELGMNFQAIALCTLGIARINHGKACMLLLDCERASDYAKCINLKRTEESCQDVFQPAVIPDINFMQSMDLDSCYSQNSVLPTAMAEKITLIEHLPMTKFSISNYEDFGNEGIIDFDGSESQGFLFTDVNKNELVGSQNANIEPSPVKENELVERMEYETPVLPSEHLEIEESPNSSSQNYDFSTTRDVDQQIAVEENPPNEVTDMDLDSLKPSVLSTKRRNKRKRNSMLDEVIAISQTEMRENMNNYSDIVLDGPDIAPPTKRLMGIRGESSWDVLLTKCHVIGVKKNSVPIKRINYLCAESLYTKDNELYHSPAHLRDFIDIVEDEKLIFDHSESIQKWIDDGNEMNNIDLDVNAPIDDVCVAPAHFEEIRDAPGENEEVIENNIDYEMSNESSCNTKKLKKVQREILDKLERSESSKISFCSLLERIYGDLKQVDPKLASRAFMSILEMKKLTVIDVFQSNPFEDIVLSVRK